MSTGMGSPLRARRERERGAVLLVALGVLALLAAFAAAFFGLVNVERRAAQNYTDTVRARLVARAGLERAKVQLRDLAGQRSYSSIYPIAYVPPPPPGGPPARTLPPGVDAWGYAYTDPSGVPETDPDGNPSSSWKSTLLATERRSLATTSTPSYAVNSGRAIPGLPGPRFLIYSGKQGETYANGADVYRLKILDAASQINLNHPDRLSLQRMLRNLIRSRFSRFQGDPAAANRLAQKIVEGRPTSGYAAKGDLDAILVSDSAPGSKDWLGPDEWLELRDDLTVHSWVDEKVIRPWALNNEKDLGPLDVASDGSTLAEAPVRGFRGMRRSPINLNTANRHVLTALFAEVASNGTSGKFEISFPVARSLARAIEARRNRPRAATFSPADTTSGGPIKSWEQWNAFIDQVDIGSWTIADSLGAPAKTWYAQAPSSRPSPSSPAAVFGMPASGWLSGSPGDPGSTIGKLDLVSQGQRDLVKAVANPNSGIRQLGLEMNVAGSAPGLTAAPGQSATVEIPRLVDKGEIARHTTEGCFDSMGVFEITSLGRIYDQSLTVVAEQTILQVVKVYDVFRLTTQQDFELYRTFGYPGNFLSIIKGGDLDPLTKTQSAIPKTIAPDLRAQIERAEPSQPAGGMPGMLAYPQYSLVRTPDAKRGAGPYSGEWAPVAGYDMASWDGYVALSNLQGFVASPPDFVADFARGTTRAAKCRGWWDPRDQDPATGNPLPSMTTTPSHPGSDLERTQLVEPLGGTGTDWTPRIAASRIGDPSVLDDTGLETKSLDEAWKMFADGSALWPGGVCVSPERRNPKTNRARVLAYDGRNMDLNLTGCSIRFWVQPLADPFLYQKEVLFSWVGSKKKLAKGESELRSGNLRDTGFVVSKEVTGGQVHIVLRAQFDPQANPMDENHGIRSPISDWRQSARGEIKVDVTPGVAQKGWLPHSWHWVAIDFGPATWAPFGKNCVTIHLSVDGVGAGGAPRFKDDQNDPAAHIFFRTHDGNPAPTKLGGQDYVLHGHRDPLKGILGTIFTEGHEIRPLYNKRRGFGLIGWWAPTKYWFGHYYACCDEAEPPTASHTETFKNAAYLAGSASKPLVIQNRVTTKDGRSWPDAPFKPDDDNQQITYVFRPAKNGDPTPPDAPWTAASGMWEPPPYNSLWSGPDGVPGTKDDCAIDVVISWTNITGPAVKCPECSGNGLNCDEDSREGALPIPNPDDGGSNIDKLLGEYHTADNKRCWILPPKDHGPMDLLPGKPDKEHYCDDCHGCMACCVRGPMWFGAEPEPVLGKVRLDPTGAWVGPGGNANFRPIDPKSPGAVEPAFPDEGTMAHAVFDNIIIANASDLHRTDNPLNLPELSPENRFYESNLQGYMRGQHKQNPSIDLEDFGARYERALAELVGQTARLGTLSWTTYPTERRTFGGGNGKGLGSFHYVSPSPSLLEFNVGLYKMHLGTPGDYGYQTALRQSVPQLVDSSGWSGLMQGPLVQTIGARARPFGTNGLLADVDPRTGDVSPASLASGCRFDDGGEGIRFGTEQWLQGGKDYDGNGVYTDPNDTPPEILVLSVHLKQPATDAGQRTLSPILDDVTLTLVTAHTLVLYTEEGVEE